MCSSGSPTIRLTASTNCCPGTCGCNRSGRSAERQDGIVRAVTILMLLAVYGLRRGEVAALRLEQIDWTARQLRIWRLKRRQPQVYPLAPSVAEALAAYVDIVRPKVPYP